MIKAYILFVVISTLHPIIQTQEFSSREGCDHAAQNLVNVLDTQGVKPATVWCVPSNGVDK